MHWCLNIRHDIVNLPNNYLVWSGSEAPCDEGTKLEGKEARP